MSHATPLHHRGSLADSMQSMNASALPGKVYDAVDSHVHERGVPSVKWPLEPALDEEVRDALGCERSERGRRPRRPEATRSGTYKWAWWTQYGGLFALCVPKLRRGNRELHWQSIEGYARGWGPFWISSSCIMLWVRVCAICKQPCPSPWARGSAWQPVTVGCGALRIGRTPLKRHGVRPHRRSCGWMDCG